MAEASLSGVVPRSLPALLAACLVGLAPGAASAACGGAVTEPAGKKLGDFRSPLIIGDSVLLGAVDPVAKSGWDVNTRGCRSWTEGAQLVRDKLRAGRLPHLVAMFLGADWEVSTAQLAETYFRMGKSRVLVLVTPREVGGRGGEDAQNMRRFAKEHPARVILLDWVKHTKNRPGWFAPDGLHLNRPGIPGLVKFLKPALAYAEPGAFPEAPEPAAPPASPR